MSEKVRIVVADDHPVILDALTTICERERELEVVASCTGGRECLDAVRRHRPDIVILDLSMSGTGGLDVLAELREEMSSPKVIVWTAGFDRDEVVQAIRLGASSIVLKQMPPEELVSTIRRVHSGEVRVDADAIERSLEMLAANDPSEPQHPKLSDREAEVARFACQGLSNKEISALLRIGVSTVKTHLEHVYFKLGVTNRVELGNLARKEALF
ncbi:MAG TPA: response regulator transcription factor [Thermoanaerobaculia bacterium]|nr:response regulator transcription factor [Thermoanaerobaculia bacterium]